MTALRHWHYKGIHALFTKSNWHLEEVPHSVHLLTWPFWEREKAPIPCTIDRYQRKQRSNKPWGKPSEQWFFFQNHKGRTKGMITASHWSCDDFNGKGLVPSRRLGMLLILQKASELPFPPLESFRTSISTDFPYMCSSNIGLHRSHKHKLYIFIYPTIIHKE